MPSTASLAARQYYGHRRNRFWPLMARLLGAPLPVDYAHREAMLHRHGIALWDVLAGCRRQGSLDAAIERDSEQPNPIDQLLALHPGIRGLFCNGRTAAAALTRHHPDLGIAPVCLPSTSPANAAWSLERLVSDWMVMRDSLAPR